MLRLSLKRIFLDGKWITGMIERIRIMNNGKGKRESKQSRRF